MTKYKLKKIHIIRGYENRTRNKEFMMLRIGDFSENELSYHYFQVPNDAVIDVYFQMEDKLSILRVMFGMQEKQFYLQLFTYNHTTHRYEEEIIDEEMKSSPIFSKLLQNIHIYGSNHFSFITTKNMKNPEK
ncbi:MULTISPECIES: hypothetical protein [Aeribacillus]|uniref:hypothetical protein n=1 Tax=Aeribacillus TaxID=1055323 RepID=UPI0007B4E326|nr:MULTISPECIES: hypothetical protein [Aeribacillus]KZM56153.1 hypothetical protein A3Q35_00965 [Aeribacillus pallidus]MED0651674.1 hypothetical protein [Aeribacillus composti]MED4487968.1 hypothetical protein [Aeribacillus pallidus]